MNPLLLLLGLIGTAGSVFVMGGGKSAEKDVGNAKFDAVPGKNKTDTGTEQTDTGDTEQTDTGGTDTGQTDTGGAGLTDTGDTGQTDTGDTGQTDTGGTDTGQTDTGTTPDNTGTTGGTIEAPQQSGDSSAGTDDSTATPIQGNAVEVMTGRVTTLQPSDSDIASLRIVSEVEHGTITVNPDNTLALVMTKSDFTGNQSFTYEITHSDGSTSLHQTNLNVTAGAQEGGWSTGESHYVLEVDENDRTVVEHGDNHQKLYVSGSNDALTAADIARMEGLSVDQITSEWLVNSEYGRTEELALHKDIGMQAWSVLTPGNSETSNWLLLERGYDYELPSRFLVGRNAAGESELHPIYMGAYGEGDRPEITSEVLHQDVTNLVVQDIHFSGTIMMLTSNNVLFDNIMVTDGGSAFMTSSGITIRNSEFIDNARDEPAGDEWHAHVDRAAGIYVNTTDGFLLEGSFFDMNGWQEDYLTADGMPPSMFSHNIYLDAEITDLTLRDTISMRGSSFGAQARSGGYIEDNLFADNNAGFYTVGGDYEGAGAVGHYTLLSGNVITHAAYNEADMIGALSWGLHDDAQMTSLVDNIIAHLADPNGDETYKIWNHGGLELNNGAYYDDTVVWNWASYRDSENTTRITEQNTDGLDTTVLDQTTIQLFTEQLTGISGATTADLADYLRARSDGAFDDAVDADLINRFFQEGFGVATEIRDSADTLTFVPNEVSDGVRWDNRLNWDSGDLPGLYPGDAVDLNGNHVAYGSNTTIDTLDFSGGALNVYGGRLGLTGGLVDEGALNLEGTGQIWSEGSDGSALDVMVDDSARFVNTGDMSGLNLTAMDGQAILATDNGEFDVSASRVLKVFEAARVGFDDNNGDMAILDIQEGGTVAFETTDGGLGEIGEFRSGAFGDNPDVMSGIDLGGGTLAIDLNGVSGSSFQLMSADEIVGLFEEANVTGLGDRNANVVIDYTNDTVTLNLSSGNGQISIDTVGEQSDVSAGANELWNALTADQGTIDDTQNVIPDEEEELLDVA